MQKHDITPATSPSSTSRITASSRPLSSAWTSSLWGTHVRTLLPGLRWPSIPSLDEAPLSAIILRGDAAKRIEPGAVICCGWDQFDDAAVRATSKVIVSLEGLAAFAKEEVASSLQMPRLRERGILEIRMVWCEAGDGVSDSTTSRNVVDRPVGEASICSPSLRPLRSSLSKCSHLSLWDEGSRDSAHAPFRADEQTIYKPGSLVALWHLVTMYIIDRRSEFTFFASFHLDSVFRSKVAFISESRAGRFSRRVKNIKRVGFILLFHVPHALLSTDAKETSYL